MSIKKTGKKGLNLIVTRPLHKINLTNQPLSANPGYKVIPPSIKIVVPVI
jgi:hypothetical protein